MLVEGGAWTGADVSIAMKQEEKGVSLRYRAELEWGDSAVDYVISEFTVFTLLMLMLYSPQNHPIMLYAQ